MPSFMGSIPSTTPDSDLQLRLPLKNVGSEKIPPYAVLEIIDTDYQTGMFLKVRKPTSDNVKTIIINLEAEIPKDGFGHGTVTFPTWVQYDDADGTPGLNEQWGPANGSFKIKKGKIGFLTVPMTSGDTPPLSGLVMAWLEVCRTT